jgi:hypothetical protein
MKRWRWELSWWRSDWDSRDERFCLFCLSLSISFLSPRVLLLQYITTPPLPDMPPGVVLDYEEKILPVAYRQHKRHLGLRFHSIRGVCCEKFSVSLNFWFHVFLTFSVWWWHYVPTVANMKASHQQKTQCPMAYLQKLQLTTKFVTGSQVVNRWEIIYYYVTDLAFHTQRFSKYTVQI